MELGDPQVPALWQRERTVSMAVVGVSPCLAGCAGELFLSITAQSFSIGRFPHLYRTILS